MPKIENIFILLFFVFYGNHLSAQINVTSGQTANSLAQTLAGPGVVVSNATLVCDSNAYAQFNVAPPNVSNLGLDAGIVLTSGSAFNNGFNTGINNPPNIITTGNPSNFNDPDLAILSGQLIRDACILEFDFIPTGDTIKFQYVFGSAEYPSFTCSNFNDAFGFFISGPGIVGPFTGGSKNIAIVPGTVNCPVSINTINCPNSPGCCNTSTNCVGNTANCTGLTTAQTCAMFVCNAPGSIIDTTVVYPGFTIPLIATAVTVPCSTYHLKLAVADASDQSLDSGVFLKAGSLSSNNIGIQFTTGLGGNTPYIVEGCDSLRIKIVRRLSPNTIVTADTVNLSISGNATMGVDYNNIPNIIYFSNSINDTIQEIIIAPVSDGIFEPNEFVNLALQQGCNNIVTDSVSIQIKDSLVFTFTNNDTAICLGQSIAITTPADAGINFVWTPTTGVTPPNIFNTTITPTTIGSTTYSVTGSYLTCPPITKSFKITTDPVPVIQINSNFTLCSGDTFNLNAITNYPNLINYTWSPSAGLSTSQGSSTIFWGTNSQNYVLTGTSINANCTASAPINATVFSSAVGSVNITDTMVCGGESLQLIATGNTGNYLWYPTTFISCTTCPDPIVNPPLKTTYSVVFISPTGCNDTATSTVQINPPFTLSLVNKDTTIEVGERIDLQASGAFSYFWDPNYYISNVSNAITFATPFDTVSYTVIGYDSLGECPQIKGFKVNTFEKDLFVPNAFSPNGDKLNDILKLSSKTYIKLLEFRIFNRWGNEVFSAKSLSDGWDGTLHGKECDLGTYYYTAQWNYPSGKVVKHTGSILLLR